MAKVSDGAIPMLEVWRGGLLECTHLGHAVICDDKGVVASWGNPDAVIFPRSSAKMIQALPLIETGAADARAPHARAESNLDQRRKASNALPR